ncbi:hypothetical protein MTO96_035493 [Rhipicephalus appendiculatus]
MSDDFESVDRADSLEALSSKDDEDDMAEPIIASADVEQEHSAFTKGIIAVVGSQAKPHICYRYPVTPVYIRLPKSIKEVGDIYMQMVMPVDFKRVHWEFTHSSDRHHVWNSTEIVSAGHHKVRVTFQDLVDGKEDKYEWHNSDVGSVAPVFKPHSEHFMQLHYDDKEKQLVTYFTLYGTVFIPELVIPCEFKELPLTVNLNGAVAYNDTYTIRFHVKPPGKRLSLNFGEISFDIDLEEHKEQLHRATHEELQVSSHSSCAFLSLNRKMVANSMRRLVTPVMIIDGDIEITNLHIGKG